MSLFGSLSVEQKIIILSSNSMLAGEEQNRLQELLTQKPDWSFIVRYTIRHGTAPLAYKCLNTTALRANVPQEVLASLKGNYLQTSVKNALAFKAFHEALHSFHQAGIPTILLKGVAVALSVYKDAGLRPMGDIDIMVPPDKLIEAEKLLLEKGFKCHIPYKSKRLRLLNIHNHLNVFEKNGARIELHWALNSIHHIHRLPSAYIWGNIKEISIDNCKDCKAYILDLHANLMYLSIHAINHFYKNRIRLNSFVDIAALIKKHKDDLNWHTVADKSREFDVSLPAAQTLHILRTFFLTAIPKSVSDIQVQDANKLEKNFSALLHDKQETISYKAPSSYIKKIKAIKGFKNKILYLWVETFPSPQYMMYTYKLRKKYHVYPFYFVQFLKQVKKTIRNLWYVIVKK